MKGFASGLLFISSLIGFRFLGEVADVQNNNLSNQTHL